MQPPPVLPEPPPSAEKTLRHLFLTLFLRGRGIRGMNRQNKDGAPKSVAQKLALTLFFYALIGCVALAFIRQPVFALAVYLHAMTFAFVGMFVAASAGEILFNKEEADILMHRPVTPRTMLWAKIRVLVEVSLWLAGAFNLAGLFAGFVATRSWWFPVVHIFSMILEALFCTGCVVLVYQLCLRWFGRERLEGLMTIAQVLISIAAVMSGQILPQLVMRVDRVLDVHEVSWWIHVLPPAWFAGLDDAVAGSRSRESWVLGALAIAATGCVLWLAFGKLAQSYETGLQALNETVSSRVKKSGGRRLLDRIVNVPPLSWWLRDPVTRASFLLVSAYLIRDRDVKLRVYPGIAPILIIPIVFLLRGPQAGGMNAGFGIPFTGAYLGMLPLFGLQMLQYSQQYQAAEIFRVAPIAGPAPLYHGARRAVICLLMAPVLILVSLIVWLLRGNLEDLLLFIPGLIALPAFSLVPALSGQGVPLSMPTDAAKAAGRSLNMFLVTFLAIGLSALASFAWSHGWFWPLVACEAVVVAVVYVLMYSSIARGRWPADET